MRRNVKHLAKIV